MYVNVRQMVTEVNEKLTLMDEQYNLAKKAFGVRPDMERAKQAVNDAGTTIMELASLLDQMVAVGFQHPPDVIQRVCDRYAGVHQLSGEIAECEFIIKIRSCEGRPQNTLN